MGNILFTITIEAIEERNNLLATQIPPAVRTIMERGMDRNEERKNPWSFATKPIDRFNSGEFSHKSTPIKAGTSDGIFRYMDESGRGFEEDDTRCDTDDRNEAGPTWSNKYVDDINVCEHLALDNGIKSITTNREAVRIRAVGCEEEFITIKTNAEGIGMRVNNKKTQLICVSAHPHLDITCTMDIGGKEIESEKNMKVLGFILDHKVGMEGHIKHITKKYSMIAWTLRHLKKANVPQKALVEVYCALIRSVLEYAAQLFHHSITGDQSEKIERVQRWSLKSIFEFGTSYRRALDLSGLERLDSRRHGLCLRFAKKTETNPRYKHWFPANPPLGHDLRLRKRLLEEFAATERMRKSPIFSMRRMLNEDEQTKR